MKASRRKEWRPLPGYSRYRISDAGDVEDMEAGQLLKATHAVRGGYPKVFLRDHLGGTVHHTVHNLVVRTFVGPPPSPQSLIMHRDHDVQNSHVSNLAWGTHKTNAAGRLERGTVLRGEQLHNAVLTEEKALAIREAYSKGATTTQVAEAFGISRQNVNNIVRGRSWMHVGGPMAPPERRKRKGEKLTEQQVREIRASAEAGAPLDLLATEYGITRGAVYMIVTRRRWPNVK
jgi:transposase